MIAIRSSKEII